jgi:hypothetical protein
VNALSIVETFDPIDDISSSLSGAWVTNPVRFDISDFGFEFCYRPFRKFFWGVKLR